MSRYFPSDLDWLCPLAKLLEYYFRSVPGFEPDVRTAVPGLDHILGRM